MRHTILALGLVLLGAPAARARETRCPAHQHEKVETDADEGGTVKHCVCDDGWDANGPAPPCKKPKAGKSKKS